ncbi:MAG: Ig-like domain-containing protein, partial [Lachnospiraceae bacterium]|nr:Ig-like domain-containing protein [Lachnospiraceae bacterium]MDY2759558.1 Ig-like domain-containing protein [Lachnospiraceae bacterium]
AITYTSSDTDVATVAADGTITAVAPGTAVVTVKAAETDKVNAGTATIVVTVPSNPQKVTGVKVSNKKGAYVTVKWTSQGSNVNYRVYKKVGNGKWVGKNVAGSKTTLSVKKGAKVQVKVKSYVKDASGKTTWGPTATKAKTFKTDKK